MHKRSLDCFINVHSKFVTCVIVYTIQLSIVNIISQDYEVPFIGTLLLPNLDQYGIFACMFVRLKS